MMLVREMAVITWKKLRLEKFEHDYCTRQLAAQITQEEFLSINPLFTEVTYQFRINTGGLSERNAELLAREVDYIKPFRSKSVTVAQLLHIKTEFKVMYSWIISEYQRITPLDSGEPSLEEIVSKKVLRANLTENYLVPYCVNEMLMHSDAGLQCVKFREQIEEGIVQIR